jgi:nucleoside-diphosphate-sugar epimerase
VQRALKLLVTGSAGFIGSLLACTTTDRCRQAVALREQRVEVLGTALSAESPYAFFYANFSGSGTNSLHPVSGDQQERIAATTLDDFLDVMGASLS